MSIHRDRALKHLSLILGVVTIVDVVLLLVQDAAPKVFPAISHSFLAAFSLALIACAYLIFQLAHRRAPMELLKAVLLAAAFLFWAANQFWPNLAQAALLNDIAIALFVLDVFLVVAGWPSTSNESVFAESDETDAKGGEHSCYCCRNDEPRRTCKACAFDS